MQILFRHLYKHQQQFNLIYTQKNFLPTKEVLRYITYYHRDIVVLPSKKTPYGQSKRKRKRDNEDDNEYPHGGDISLSFNECNDLTALKRMLMMWYEDLRPIHVGIASRALYRIIDAKPKGRKFRLADHIFDLVHDKINEVQPQHLARMLKYLSKIEQFRGRQEAFQEIQISIKQQQDKVTPSAFGNIMEGFANIKPQLINIQLLQALLLRMTPQTQDFTPKKVCQVMESLAALRYQQTFLEQKFAEKIVRDFSERLNEFDDDQITVLVSSCAKQKISNARFWSEALKRVNKKLEVLSSDAVVNVVKGLPFLQKIDSKFLESIVSLVRFRISEFRVPQIVVILNSLSYFYQSQYDHMKLRDKLLDRLRGNTQQLQSGLQERVLRSLARIGHYDPRFFGDLRASIRRNLVNMDPEELASMSEALAMYCNLREQT
eukprot:TRINITY_DN7745_c0_g3_i1.p1 TRINITY_DN7745_c0_g3~~TRINITY_DN7745_c0_g3_i1.p1  ORF type:complete len:498 (+),score=45.12 TRINITY_DN7745_c0_g3_i1:197-1495(+)